MPPVVQELYQNFAPPTSKYYKDNVLKSIGSGFALKELREHAKTLNIKDHHKLKRKELINELHGKGYFDWITTVKDKVKHYFNKIPKPIKDAVQAVIKYSRNIDSFNAKSKKTLQEYGSKEIKSIKIFREKIDGILRKAISVISDHQGNLYHLGMVITLDDNQEITVEKNHVVNVVKGSPFKNSTEVMDVSLQGKHITLNELLDKTIEAMTPNVFFDYNGITNNCQNFVMNILKTNHLLSKEAEDFTLQNLDDLVEKSRLGEDTEDIIKGATNIRASIDNLTGFGVKKSLKYRLRK